jgi:iron complex transport system substrate-binding protein
MDLCGADNVFAGLPELAAVIDEEAVLEADPHAMIAGYYPGKGEGWRRRWQSWPQLRAVRNGHLYTVPAETMERHTPRALEAARQLCARIDRARPD